MKNLDENLTLGPANSNKTEYFMTSDVESIFSSISWKMTSNYVHLHSQDRTLLPTLSSNNINKLLILRRKLRIFATLGPEEKLFL